MEEYQLYEKTVSEVCIEVTYYMYTTITTVGFGDRHPMNTVERAVCIMTFLFGVMMSTVLMG